MRISSRGRARRAGFTLMELVVVMIILSILAGTVVVYVTKNIKDARRTRALADIKQFQTAIDTYEAHNGFPPSQQQGLEALITKPTAPPEPLNWRGPYLKAKSVPKDPWNHDYVYTVSGDEYTIISYGEDGVPGGNDADSADISSEAN